MVSTDERRRDFIASEIQKRIIGPGMTHDAFLCMEDSSDEVLDNRPNIVYTAGILYAKKSSVEKDQLTLEENPKIEATEDEVVSETNNSSDDIHQYADESKNRGSRQDASTNINENESADFEPDHIGLITCLNENADKVNVDIKYGLYHHIQSGSVSQSIKVRLGRCSIEQLKSTFEYYNRCSSVRTNIKLFGCDSIWDVFSIDEHNFTVSPKRIFSRQEEGKQKLTYLQATSFPRLLRNKAADILLHLLKEQGQKIELKLISWDELLCEFKIFAELSSVQEFMTANNINVLESAIEYDKDKNSVRTKKRDLKIDNIGKIGDQLYVDDPVYDHILPLLLQYNFFKREQVVIDTFPIDIQEGSYSIDVPGVDYLKLHWKVLSRNSKKYLKVQLQNVFKIPASEDKKVQVPIEANLYQTELKISSDGIIPYTEPHRSSIDDEEYTINEQLYREVKMYGKGVNCGMTWDGCNSDIDGEYNPKWVKTTYAPMQRAAAFSPSTKDKSTNDACVVYDLSLWSKLNKEEALSILRQMADNYKVWHREQKSSSNQATRNIIQEQEEFHQRLVDNIDYLEKNERAYKCFQVANTAMYIQMIIARDKKFKKDRDISTYKDNTHIFKDGAWEFFCERNEEIKYRPFQLAFLLMNVKSTFENDDPYRDEFVDLIWFPTGGGKTEAYLALTALTIAERRTSRDNDVSGISVIMRYTLRLLTAQQFERASFLICALEFLRNHLEKKTEYRVSLGNSPITLGMWIGSASTPNKLSELNNGKYANYFSLTNKGDKPTYNPFPISYCPWCGCKLESEGNPSIHGYDKKGNVICINNSCHFSSLPIIYIDECIYDNPPTLLFATVDKFAQLTALKVGKMFGVGSDRRRPDLIIQDEMHLISGPLGSLVGMFESMIETICTKDVDGKVRRPKIIASTATTRNTHSLIKQIYARDLKTFPVSGITYSDNYFSHVLNNSESKRLYMGIAPTGHSASELEIRAIAAEIVGKEKMISEYLLSKNVNINDQDAVYKTLTNNSSLIKDIDDYWSLVLYYMNLKSLGRTHSRIGQEIVANAESMRSYLNAYPSLDFVINGFQSRTEEFTSRQDSSRIKSLLVEAETSPIIEKTTSGKAYVKYNMDIVQATNMISVGIDIARWNVIFMVGQPLTTAEYIQSSSRVGRTTHGLVVDIYNSMRNRELSFYENFIPYHQEFYKFVEPLMATTFTPITLEKLVYNLYFCYMGAVKGIDRPSGVSPSDLAELKALLTSRNDSITSNASMSNLIINTIDKVHGDLSIAKRNNYTFAQILSTTSSDDLKNKVMTSLRDIESNTYIKYE